MDRPIEIGDIVVYRYAPTDAALADRPAIVAKVHQDPTAATVDLVAFGTRPALPATFLSGVPYDMTGKTANSWHWKDTETDPT